jgi:avirulence protein
MDKEYAYLTDRLAAQDVQPRLVKTGVPLPMTRATPRDFMAHNCLQQTLQLNGQTIPLTQLALPVNPADFGSALAQDWRNQNAADAIPEVIHHTAPQYIQAIVNHVETLVEDLLGRQRSSVEVVQSLADIHWLMAHAMPDSRGGAAKTELCVRALANAHGVELPPFKHGVIPDLEAFLSDQATFRARYASMFDGPLVAATQTDTSQLR